MFCSIKTRFTEWWKHLTKLKPGRDSFFLLDYFLVLAGIHLLTRNGYLRTVWNFYRALLFIHVVLMTRKVMEIFQTEDNFQLIANNMIMCVGCFIIFARCVFIVTSFKQVNSIRNLVNRREFQANDPTAMAIRQSAFNNAIFVTLFMAMNSLTQTFMVLFTDLGKTESLLLPFDLVGLSSSENFILQRIYSGMFSIYVFLASTNFLAVYLPLTALKAEMRIVVYSYSKITNQVEDRMSGLGHDAVDDSNEAHFWEILQDELTQCVRAHAAVLDKVGEFKKLSDPTFLLLYYMTMLYAAIGVIAVLFTPKLNTFNTISLEYSMRYMLECFVFCHVVSNFNEQHNNIVNKLSQFHWGVDLRYSKRFSREYKQIRSMVLMIIMQSQKSLNFSCGGLFELTMGSFTTIVNKTYTLTMYFWNIKKRE
ncbi:hypothetical protein RP20_CCG003919 [Aedes albopictus]|nr:hypothetical protein RP20_CCG003919 [Aedes albopictus]